MPREDREVLTVAVSPSFADGLDIVKSLLMTDSEATGITNQSSLSEVYHACAVVGLSTLLMQMKADGSYDEHKSIVDLGNDVDELLG